jgi:hypothetical protein
VYSLPFSPHPDDERVSPAFSELTYKAGDLLALLELQLSIEQIDPKALAGLAEERLRHYIHVLEEQSRGAQYKFGSLAARAEYERFSVAGEHPSVVWFGLTWTFL